MSMLLEIVSVVGGFLFGGVWQILMWMVPLLGALTMWGWSRLSPTPLYVHDCERCVWLGTYVLPEGWDVDGVRRDLYVCHGDREVFLERDGDDGNSYGSGSRTWGPLQHPALIEAARRWDTGDYPTEAPVREQIMGALYLGMAWCWDRVAEGPAWLSDAVAWCVPATVRERHRTEAESAVCWLDGTDTAMTRHHPLPHGRAVWLMTLPWV